MTNKFDKDDILGLFKKARSQEEKRIAKKIREAVGAMMDVVEAEQYHRFALPSALPLPRPHSLTEVFFFSPVVFSFVDRLELAIQVQSFDGKTTFGEPFFALDPGSTTTYSASLTTLVISLLRRDRAREDANLPTMDETLRPLVRQFGLHPTKENLHAMVLHIIRPFPEDFDDDLDTHTLGMFMQLSSVRANGFANLERLNHTLVHLIYLARIFTFCEIVGNNEVDRATLLEQVHIE